MIGGKNNCFFPQILNSIRRCTFHVSVKDDIVCNVRVAVERHVIILMLIYFPVTISVLYDCADNESFLVNNDACILCDVDRNRFFIRNPKVQ